MTKELMLPAEVAQIAQGVSVEKRNEVQAVLNHVFEGVDKMRQQLDQVTVTDENDNLGMKMANTIRLSVRQVRLDAEKTFDAKRAEVQQQMLSYKTEDSLWLKAKQTMQILTKEIEDQARWKEETRKRWEAEQKELTMQRRAVEVAKYADDVTRAEYEGMSDTVFGMFIEGLKKKHDDRVAAEKKAEEERIAAEKREAEERERIRKENERLKAEAEAREKQLAEQRAKAEAERKAAEERERKAKAEAEAKLKAEREAREKIEAELRAKQEAEEKARREEEARIAAEKKAEEEAERRAKNAPDRMKLKEMAGWIEQLPIPEVRGDDVKKVVETAKAELMRIAKYIRSKAAEL